LDFAADAEGEKVNPVSRTEMCRVVHASVVSPHLPKKTDFPHYTFQASSKYSPLVAMHLRSLSIRSRKTALKVDFSISLNGREKLIGSFK
jgi:hypothetical protein